MFILAIFLSFVIGSVSIDSKDAVSDSVSNETKKPDAIERMFSSTPVLAQPDLELEAVEESIPDKKPEESKTKKPEESKTKKPEESKTKKPEEPKTKKPPPKKSKPKADLIEIECPGCNAQMKVPKLNKLQEVSCKECGLSGEIEI